MEAESSSNSRRPRLGVSQIAKLYASVEQKGSQFTRELKMLIVDRNQDNNKRQDNTSDLSEKANDLLRAYIKGEKTRLLEFLGTIRSLETMESFQPNNREQEYVVQDVLEEVSAEEPNSENFEPIVINEDDAERTGKEPMQGWYEVTREKKKRIDEQVKFEEKRKQNAKRIDVFNTHIDVKKIIKSKLQ